MSGWIDTDDVREYVRSHLTKADALKPHWDLIIDQATTAAYGTIVSAFAARGFIKSQIDQWDRGAEFQKDIAAWWALKRLAVIHPDAVGQQHLTELDRRPELLGNKDMDPVPLTINGEAVFPQGEFGTVTVGPVRTTDDLFVMDVDDGRIGETTRW